MYLWLTIILNCNNYNIFVNKSINKFEFLKYSYHLINLYQKTTNQYHLNVES